MKELYRATDGNRIYHMMFTAPVVEPLPVLHSSDKDQVKNRKVHSIFSTVNQSPTRMYSVNRVFSGLAHHHISHSPLLFHRLHDY